LGHGPQQAHRAATLQRGVYVQTGLGQLLSGGGVHKPAHVTRTPSPTKMKLVTIKMEE